MYDVIVAGGGPGGSVAAQTCARKGLRTLLVERKRLPRDKVCSGMIMGPWANDIIEHEFGKIHKAVLVSPFYLSEQVLHVPGVPPQTIKCKTPLAWRKDLDFWMIQKAQGCGVEIWDGVKVTRVEQEHGVCTTTIIRHQSQKVLKSTFVIGADGAASVVRKSLMPKLKVLYSVPIRECYKGALDLEKDAYHWFFPKYRSRPRFGLNHKGDCFLIEGSGIKALRNEIDSILAKYGFNPEKKAIWKDGCLNPQLHEALISGAFSPAWGNVLLIGDAAGLLLPITFEGIGPALKSGRLAADSVIEAADSGKDAASIYLKKIKSIVKVIKDLHVLSKKLENSSVNDSAKVVLVLKNAYAQAIR
jgi:flavin-dependent dehydrogenase